MPFPNIKYFVSTLLALVAFAGNSVLCRLALQETAIDATSFTIVRLLAGAVTLWILVFAQDRLTSQSNQGEVKLIHGTKKFAWRSALMLFIYAACFSYAYIMLDAGLGALILFACVQITMVVYSFFTHQKLSFLQYTGLLLAFAGLVYLVISQHESSSPNTSVNFSMLGFILMLGAGFAWAIYTLLAKHSLSPVTDTRNNFIRSCVFLVPLCLVYAISPLSVSSFGLALALASGAITSGLGYAIWYYALKALQAAQAGVVQLLVPVIAALGGVIWIGESITAELIVSQTAVLAGIALVIFTPNRVSK